MPVLMWIRQLLGKPSRRPVQLRGYAIVEKDRSGVAPYPYVYVNADGTARELHADECDYLETPFSPGDGARPYVKGSYSQRNGWGEISGFLKRSELPSEIVIQAAPLDNPSKPMTRSDQIQFLRDKGLIVTENPDGSFTARKPKATL